MYHTITFIWNMVTDKATIMRCYEIQYELPMLSRTQFYAVLCVMAILLIALCVGLHINTILLNEFMRQKQLPEIWELLSANGYLNLVVFLFLIQLVLIQQYVERTVIYLLHFSLDVSLTLTNMLILVKVTGRLINHHKDAQGQKQNKSWYKYFLQICQFSVTIFIFEITFLLFIYALKELETVTILISNCFMAFLFSKGCHNFIKYLSILYHESKYMKKEKNKPFRNEKTEEEKILTNITDSVMVDIPDKVKMVQSTVIKERTKKKISQLFYIPFALMILWMSYYTYILRSYSLFSQDNIVNLLGLLLPCFLSFVMPYIYSFSVKKTRY